MHQAFGPLLVELKYSYIAPSGIIYFQLPVPVELRERFGKKTIKESTKTKDIVVAARNIETLLRKYRAEFAVLRGSPDVTSQSMSALTEALLRRHGLKAGDGATLAPTSHGRAFNYSAADEAAMLEVESASAKLDRAQQSTKLEQELFKQRTRLVDLARTLQTKTNKMA